MLEFEEAVNKVLALLVVVLAMAGATIMVGRESWADASFFLVVRRLVSISGGGDGRAEFIVIVIVSRRPVGVHLDGDGGRIRMLLLLLAIVVLLFVAFEDNVAAAEEARNK